MPELLNPKHEKFAQLLAQGTNQSEAFRMCYGEKARAITSEAARLARHERVAGRIIEIQMQPHEITEDVHELSVNWVLARLMRIAVICGADYALTDEKSGVTTKRLVDSPGALRATELIGRHLGMWAPAPTNHQHYVALVLPRGPDPRASSPPQDVVVCQSNEATIDVVPVESDTSESS